MPKTILQFGRDLYHASCLDSDERSQASEIQAKDIEDDEVCNECNELLTAEDAPEDAPEAP